MVNKQPKIVNEISYKNKQNEQKQQQITNEQPTSIDRKLIVESTYNLNMKSNMNGFNMHKDNDNNKLHNSCDNNNSKKFAFLAQHTIPDYRPQPVSYWMNMSTLKVNNNLFYMECLLFFIPLWK